MDTTPSKTEEASKRGRKPKTSSHQAMAKTVHRWRKVPLEEPENGLLLSKENAEELVQRCRETVGEGRIGVVFNVATTTGAVAVKLWRIQRRLQASDFQYLRMEAATLRFVFHFIIFICVILSYVCFLNRACNAENVVRLIGYYDKPSCVCLVTELCENGTLADFAKKNKMICKSLAKRFALELGLLFHVISSFLTFFLTFFLSLRECSSNCSSAWFLTS